jgi:hypothetical protein
MEPVPRIRSVFGLPFADAPPNVAISTMASAVPLDPDVVDRLPMNQQAEAFERLRDSIGG